MPRTPDIATLATAQATLRSRLEPWPTSKRHLPGWRFAVSHIFFEKKNQKTFRLFYATAAIAAAIAAICVGA